MWGTLALLWQLFTLHAAGNAPIQELTDAEVAGHPITLHQRHHHVYTLPRATSLLTEYLESKYAVGLTTTVPRFSWKIPMLNATSLRGQQQSSYRIRVRRDKHTVWDSRWVGRTSRF